MLRKLRSFCIISAAILAQYFMHLPDATDPLTMVGGIATIINLTNTNQSTHTELRLVDGELVIILHGFSETAPSGIQGISFGHVVLTNKDPETHREYHIVQHELAHVKQHSTLGKSYTIIYGMSLLYSYISTGTYDENNPLEWGPYHNHPVAWWWKDPFVYDALNFNPRATTQAKKHI